MSGNQHLYTYNLLSRPQSPIRFRLAEVIYCRLIFWLRKYYSFQRLKYLIHSCDQYSNNLISKNYGILDFLDEEDPEIVGYDEDNYHQIKLVNKLDNYVEEKLVDTYLYQESKLVDIVLRDKHPDMSPVFCKVTFCYINLKKIRNELIIRAYEYNVDSIEKKFNLD